MLLESEFRIQVVLFECYDKHCIDGFDIAKCSFWQEVS